MLRNFVSRGMLEQIKCYVGYLHRNKSFAGRAKRGWRGSLRLAFGRNDTDKLVQWQNYRIYDERKLFCWETRQVFRVRVNLEKRYWKREIKHYCWAV